MILKDVEAKCSKLAHIILSNGIEQKNVYSHKIPKRLIFMFLKIQNSDIYGHTGGFTNIQQVNTFADFKELIQLLFNQEKFVFKLTSTSRLQKI